MLPLSHYLTGVFLFCCHFAETYHSHNNNNNNSYYQTRKKRFAHLLSHVVIIIFFPFVFVSTLTSVSLKPPWLPWFLPFVVLAAASTALEEPSCLCIYEAAPDFSFFWIL
uniref:Uncharacterized protein n=1 Tax=Populus davidiana TaxID=266767 RepID=A0A6M2EDB7_9ROSI